MKIQNNMVLLYRLIGIVQEQLDVSNLVTKINNVDLVNYLLFNSSKCEHIKQLYNPKYLEEGQGLPLKLMEYRMELLSRLIPSR